MSLMRKLNLNSFSLSVFLNKKLVFILLLFLISACSSIPKNTADGCSIFSERYFWYKHVKKTEKKWGTPVHLQ